jgi:site-specific recombinase XerD
MRAVAADDGDLLPGGALDQRRDRLRASGSVSAASSATRASYNLRHSFASVLISQGRLLEEIAQLMGLAQYAQRSARHT